MPVFYKSALQNYPFKPLGEIDCVEDNLVEEFNWIIDSNLELRSCRFFGNFIFINLNEVDEVIYFADHEEEFDPENIEDLELTSNLDEYIQQCKEEQQDVVKNV